MKPYEKQPIQLINQFKYIQSRVQLRIIIRLTSFQKIKIKLWKLIKIKSWILGRCLSVIHLNKNQINTLHWNSKVLRI